MLRDLLQVYSSIHCRFSQRSHLQEKDDLPGGLAVGEISILRRGELIYANGTRLVLWRLCLGIQDGVGDEVCQDIREVE